MQFRGLDCSEPFVDDADFSAYPFVKGRLVEFVRFKSRYAPLAWCLLGKTLVVDSLDAALQLSDYTRAGYTFVTLQRRVPQPGRLVRLGPLGKATGLISRRSRMNQLEETIAGINAEIAQLESHIQRNTQTKAHLEKLCKDLRTAIYEANTEKMQINVQAGSLRARHQAAERGGAADRRRDGLAGGANRPVGAEGIRLQAAAERVGGRQQRARGHIEEMEIRYDELKGAAGPDAGLDGLEGPAGPGHRTTERIAADHRAAAWPDPGEPADAGRRGGRRAGVRRAIRRGPEGHPSVRVPRLGVVRRERSGPAGQPDVAGGAERLVAEQKQNDELVVRSGPRRPRSSTGSASSSRARPVGCPPAGPGRAGAATSCRSIWRRRSPAARPATWTGSR